jgi:hypothetical protein
MKKMTEQKRNNSNLKERATKKTKNGVIQKRQE